MSAREIVFLGTSSQVPTRARNHHALYLRWDDAGILFDPGEGTQRQLIHAGISTHQITHIAITHFHGDHCLGLAGIVQRISLDRVPHEITIAFPASGQQYVERMRGASIYDDQAKLALVPITGDGNVARAGALTFHARRLDHVVECFGYCLQEDDGHRLIAEKLEIAGVRGPLAGELLRKGAVEAAGKTVRLADVAEPRPGQRFAFVMDTRPCEGARELASGADLLVCEATYLDDARAEALERGHMTARLAAELARDAGVRRLALTHFSQRYQDLSPFAAEARAIHADTIVGDDLVVCPVPDRRG